LFKWYLCVGLGVGSWLADWHFARIKNSTLEKKKKSEKKSEKKSKKKKKSLQKTDFPSSMPPTRLEKEKELRALRDRWDAKEKALRGGGDRTPGAAASLAAPRPRRRQRRVGFEDAAACPRDGCACDGACACDVRASHRSGYSSSDGGGTARGRGSALSARSALRSARSARSARSSTRSLARSARGLSSDGGPRLGVPAINYYAVDAGIGGSRRAVNQGAPDEGSVWIPPVIDLVNLGHRSSSKDRAGSKRSTTPKASAEQELDRARLQAVSPVTDRSARTFETDGGKRYCGGGVFVFGFSNLGGKKKKKKKKKTVMLTEKKKKKKKNLPTCSQAPLTHKCRACPECGGPFDALPRGRS
jgi:hypothetical protein